MIETFQAVVEHRSVTAAARSLGVSQPAVSAALARLEKAVGFPLFRKDGRHIAPTSEALLLHDEAARALAGFAQLEDVAAGISAGRRGTLTIASNPSPGIAWLPAVVSAFRRGRPDCRVRLLTRSSETVRSMVSARAFDLGIAEPPFDRSDSVLRRYRVALVCVLRADHPVAAPSVITPALLEREELIATSRAQVSNAAVARAFEAAGARFDPVIQCEFFAVALNLVAHGAGICLADAVSAAEAVRQSSGSAALVVRPFAPAVPYEVALLRPALGDLGLLTSQFVSALDDHLAPYLIRTDGDPDGAST